MGPARPAAIGPAQGAIFPTELPRIDEVGSRGGLVVAVVATAGLVVGGVYGGLALAGPPKPARAHVVEPAYSGKSVTTTTTTPTTTTPTDPLTTTTATATPTTTSTQLQPAIGAPAGCGSTNTCDNTTTTAPGSP